MNKRIKYGASMPSTRCLNPTSKSASDRPFSKQPRTESGYSHHRGVIVSNTPHNRKPIKGALEGSSAGNSSLRSLDASGSRHEFFIASSTLGEVKISLNYDSAVGQLNFQVPDFKAVVKCLEDKYLRIYKVVLPHFSVMSLLKDLCECYLKLGTASVGSSSPEMRKFSNYLHSQEPNNAASRGGSCDLALRKRALLLGCSSGQKYSWSEENIIYQNAYLHISLAWIADSDCCYSCSGDCLSCFIPCACAHETGGDFAYMQQGLLKEEFLNACISKPLEHHLVFCQECPLERSKNEYIVEKCKGHLIRKFIKECWRKCGCDMKCGNQVVQRGITCNLQVFMTHEGRGWGLGTLKVPLFVNMLGKY